MKSSEMSCGDVRTLLDAWLTKELLPEEAMQVKEHVDACTACQRELRSIRILRAIVNELQQEVPIATDRKMIAFLETVAEQRRSIGDLQRATEDSEDETSRTYTHPSLGWTWKAVATIAGVTASVAITNALGLPPGTQLLAVGGLLNLWGLALLPLVWNEQSQS